MEREAVIEARRREVLEIRRRDRQFVLEQLDLELALGGLELGDLRAPTVGPSPRPRVGRRPLVSRLEFESSRPRRGATHPKRRACRLVARATECSVKVHGFALSLAGLAMAMPLRLMAVARRAVAPNKATRIMLLAICTATTLLAKFS